MCARRIGLPCMTKNENRPGSSHLESHLPWTIQIWAIRYLEWVAGEGFKDGKSRSRPAALR